MRALVAVSVASALLLAGCAFPSGGPGASATYPEAFMIGTYGVPAGFALMDEDHFMWGMVTEFGMTENPGWADPESFEDDDGLPLPQRIYAAFYVDGDMDPWAGEQGTLVVSMAAEMASEADARAIVAEGDLCEDEGERGHDGYGTTQNAGVHIALLAYMGETDVRAHLDDVGRQIRAATGAERVC